ncbi:hypothetical protein [uncultured Psychrobacter sp.]|uniref:hypothetical protein n=1 Tax=uncultured Psychrobacter sp. TaxID=259303 RepID=UPI0026114363|nr:hypothetical protein [uncultured Psychrobacter sp.]
MKSNAFNYSILAVGVAALMGVSTGAMAATPTSGSDITVDVDNQATATYFVAGNTDPDDRQSVTSNEVTVKVNELSSFELLDDNTNETINPQANQSVEFTHTLENKGNVTDTYTLDLTNAGDDNFDYSGFTITYTTPTNTTPTSYVDTDGITLAPNEVATITIVATSNIKRKVGDNGIITVTASSKYLEGKGGNEDTYQAVNTDNAITKTPIYAINKSANTNLGNNVFDAANDAAYIDYSIVVKNEGNADAKAFNIEDALPAGLVALTDTSNTLYKAPTAVISGSTGTASTPVTPTFTNSDKTVNVIGQDLQQGETITVTFRAIKDPDVAIATDDNLVNYAQVEDDTLNDDNANDPDLIDRSDTVSGGGTDENNYEDPNLPEGQDGKDDNTDATVSTVNQIRDITISADPKKEVALVSSGNVYNYIIKNEGKEVTEADGSGEVFFTVVPTAGDDDIDFTRVFVDANGNGVFDTDETVLTPTEVDGVNRYDLNDAVEAGLGPDAEVNIGVEVATNGTAGNGEKGDIGNSETMTITVTANNTINGTLPPAAVDTESTTTMEGIILTKQQAVASCGALPSSLTYVSTELTGTPGQCIYYKITAASTFEEAANVVSNVVITDEFDTGKVEYNLDLTADIGGTSEATNPSYSSPTLTATFDSLEAGATGTVYFSNTIIATGATTP